MQFLSKLPDEGGGHDEILNRLKNSTDRLSRLIDAQAGDYIIARQTMQCFRQAFMLAPALMATMLGEIFLTTLRKDAGFCTTPDCNNRLDPDRLNNPLRDPQCPDCDKRDGELDAQLGVGDEKS